MTAPASVPTTVAWYARPKIVLPFLLVCVLLTGLLAKTPTSGRDGDPRLTTRSEQPLGAKLFFELAGRIGFKTVRSSSATAPARTNEIYAVLDPVVEFEPREVHEVLQHVRAGGALLLVLGAGTEAFSDSLMISPAAGRQLLTHAADVRKCDTTRRFATQGLWLGGAQLYGLDMPAPWRSAAHPFVQVDSLPENDQSTKLVAGLAVVGLRYEKGDIVVASDPDVFRNDALRECAYGLDVASVAMLDYLRNGDGVDRHTIVFDEYRQTVIGRSGPVRLLRRYLSGTPSGRMLLQICVAGLILLIGAVPRVLPPREDRILERRSPLEHVDALARAYAQVGATRTGVLRLVRGLQRRLTGTNLRSASHRSEEEFLKRLADTKPALSKDIESVRHALNNTVTQGEFADVGNALTRIEAALTRT